MTEAGIPVEPMAASDATVQHATTVKNAVLVLVLIAFAALLYAMTVVRLIG